jgi:hypothetical protein
MGGHGLWRESPTVAEPPTQLPFPLAVSNAIGAAYLADAAGPDRGILPPLRLPQVGFHPCRRLPVHGDAGGSARVKLDLDVDPINPALRFSFSR